ncbi:MAG: hypothetical protein M1826_006410 [Phylliscum demangeonii]|nr:MAG: hypothetical protein M1826_006410 [Phylliscum demangeonii]
MRLSYLAVVVPALFSLSSTARPVDFTSDLHAQIRALFQAQVRADNEDQRQRMQDAQQAPAYFGHRVVDSITAPHPLNRLESGLSTGATTTARGATAVTASVTNGAQSLWHAFDRFGNWITSPAAVAHSSQSLLQSVNQPLPESVRRAIAARRPQAVQEYKRERAWRAPATKEKYEHPERDHLGRLVGDMIRIELLDAQIHGTRLPALADWEVLTIGKSHEAEARYESGLGG